MQTSNNIEIRYNEITDLSIKNKYILKAEVLSGRNEY